MTSRGSSAARVALLALALVSPSLPGCSGGVVCNCPNSGGFARVSITAAQWSPITGVAASAPCTASASVDDTVDVSSASAGTCEVRVQLMNGDAYTFSVEFRHMTSDGACACALVRAVGNSAPMLTDAGVDGPR